MPMIALPFETWRAVIDALREKGLPYIVEYAAVLERALDQHAPDEHPVSLILTDDVYLRSYTWARWHLGIPLPAQRRS